MPWYWVGQKVRSGISMRWYEKPERTFGPTHLFFKWLEQSRNSLNHLLLFFFQLDLPVPFVWEIVTAAQNVALS